MHTTHCREKPVYSGQGIEQLSVNSWQTLMTKQFVNMHSSTVHQPPVYSSHLSTTATCLHHLSAQTTCLQQSPVYHSHLSTPFVSTNYLSTAVTCLPQPPVYTTCQHKPPVYSNHVVVNLVTSCIHLFASQGSTWGRYSNLSTHVNIIYSLPWGKRS